MSKLHYDDHPDPDGRLYQEPAQEEPTWSIEKDTFADMKGDEFNLWFVVSSDGRHLGGVRTEEEARALLEAVQAST